MTRVLVAHDPAAPSVAAVAQAIAQSLITRGFEVEVSPVTRASDVHDYGAVIVGGAVHQQRAEGGVRYLGRWNRETVRYLESQSAELIRRPTWLFQSEPDDWEPELGHVGTPYAVAKLCYDLGLEPPVTFGAARSGSEPGAPQVGRPTGEAGVEDRIESWVRQITAHLAPTEESGAADARDLELNRR